MIESDLSETVTVVSTVTLLASPTVICVERAGGQRIYLNFPAGQPLPSYGSEVQLTSHTVLAWD
jgi:hypothetical protein